MYLTLCFSSQGLRIVPTTTGCYLSPIKVTFLHLGIEGTSATQGTPEQSEAKGNRYSLFSLGYAAIVEVLDFTIVLPVCLAPIGISLSLLLVIELVFWYWLGLAFDSARYGISLWFLFGCSLSIGQVVNLNCRKTVTRKKMSEDLV
jgi:hypothetical protein